MKKAYAKNIRQIFKKVNMIVKNSKFVTSIGNASQMKDFGALEIVVAGRSNIGKSSFINYMVNNKNLAKTSQTPGRTRLINYFSINNDELYLVDLPGYGFAKVGGQDKDNWDSLIGTYLTTSKNILCVLVLVDIRHDPTMHDIHMISYLNNLRIPFIVVATKSDKFSRMQMLEHKKIIASKLGLTQNDVFPISSLKKQGLEDVLNRIQFIRDNR